MELTNDTVIKVTGIGGDGGNAAGHMVYERIEGAEFLAVNTDVQALRKTAVGQAIQINGGITKGLGVGINPRTGHNAADEGRDALCTTLEGADMVFIAAGTGGGTGTGAAPVVTEVTKDLDILTVAVTTKPLNFEGEKRVAFVEQGTTELSKYVDSLVTTPNDKLLKVLGHDISLLDTSGAANDVLKGAVQGIVELTTRPDLMNADFIDVYTVMPEMGYTVMDSGVVSGEGRTEEAAEMAISSSPLEDIDPSDTHGVLVSITAGFDLRLDEFETVDSTIRASASNNATVVIDTSLDPDMNDELRVAVAVTDIGMDKRPEITLAINEQARQPMVDRYQQHGMVPPTQGQKPVAKIVNDNALQTAKEPGYLDILAFLRKQAG